MSSVRHTRRQRPILHDFAERNLEVPVLDPQSRGRRAGLKRDVSGPSPRRQELPVLREFHTHRQFVCGRLRPCQREAHIVIPVERARLICDDRHLGHHHRRRRCAGERPLVVVSVVHEGDLHLEGLARIRPHQCVGLRSLPGYVGLVRAVHTHPLVGVGVARIAGLGHGLAVRVGDSGGRGRQLMAHLRHPRYRRHTRRVVGR